ncbi:MAG: hypothetical protein IKY18_02965 [Oscillospiraceae bacterium]|nr:hypothetical protein [Oscillospiraceae bacterium]
MKQQKQLVRGMVAACAMLVIILDTRTSVASAREGLVLCTQTIIPSLFPFFVLSGVINSCVLGQNFRLLQPLGRICKIPKGAESLLVLGFLAGYPIGARLITQAYNEERLSANTARRMLGFCNNAGPAFLFGMIAPLFSSAKTVWVLWGVHILSALISGCILPSHNSEPTQISASTGISFPESLQKAMKSTCSICGWVILFRILLGFCNRWFLWLLPTYAQVLFSGFLELSNGCVMLKNISNEGMRFLLAGIILSFGGLCVGMQTTTVTEGLGTGRYFPGKVLQTILTIPLCLLIQPILFRKSEAIFVSLPTFIGLIFCILLYVFILRRKKVVEFSARLLYNTGN